MEEMQTFGARAVHAPPEKAGTGADAGHAAAPLELSGVSVFAGRPDLPALRDVRLVIRPGEWITVLGENGSGKSTLIGVAAGLVEPDAGTVRRGFAGGGPVPFVMQQVGPFFGDTPWEEVMFALEGRGIPAEEAAARAGAALRSTGLFPVRHRPLASLSGGRRQLASVAACLATGAPLLLFDEATSMLDETSRRLVLETAKRLNREGAAVVWCTHRPEDAAAGGRIVVLADGAVAFDGLAEDFFYRETENGSTPCEALGFAPPFAVRTARALARFGRKIETRPLTAEQLAASLDPGKNGRAGFTASDSGPGAAMQADALPDVQNHIPPCDALKNEAPADDAGPAGARPVEKNGTATAGGAETGIRVEQAVCQIGGKTVLSGIDARFPAGTITLLAGPNGSGKTMLLELIAGLRKPDGGQVRVDGVPLWRGHKPDRRLLAGLGLVMQNPEQMLFARTVREEFAYSLKPCRWPPVRRAAAMERAVERWLEAGGRTAVEGAGGQESPAAGWLARDPLALSGGQRRRLAMAVTEAAEPDWLLLDEPSAGLDRLALRRLKRRLAERRAEGRGAVVAAHDVEDWIDLADAVVLMRDGRIVWSGAPDELAANPAWFAAAGLALPEPLRVAEHLRRSGFPVPSGWPDPVALAACAAAPAADFAPDAKAPDTGTAAPRHAGRPMRPAETGAAEPAGHAAVEPAGETARKPAAGPIAAKKGSASDRPAAANGGASAAGTAGGRTAAPRPERTPPLTSFDPRALWLAGLAVTAGIGMQTSWAGWLAGAATSVLAVRFSGVPARAVLRPAKALLLFALVTSLAAGWTPSGEAAFPAGGSFDVPAAVETFRRFSKLAMMAMIGFSLMAGISPWRLKRALEKGLSPVASRGVPVGRFALASALLMRFLPLLFETWERFARIAASRGKRPVKPGTVPPSLVAMTVVPFLLALIRLGDSLAAMLAARGGGWSSAPLPPEARQRRIRKTEPGRTAAEDGMAEPAFTRRDALLVAGSAALLALFVLIEKTA